MARAFDPEFPYGERTTALVQRLLDRGVTRMSLLLRHSAREYAPGRHDLENPGLVEGADGAGEGPDRIVCDFIAGMTDRFAVLTYEQIFLPQPWQVL